MKLVTSFYGMCLCVGNKRDGTGSVRLLNAAAGRKKRSGKVAAGADGQRRSELPPHHPLLLIPEANVDMKATTWQPMASVSGFATSDFHKGYLGWYLSGNHFSIGEPGPVEFTETYTAGDLLPPPSSTKSIDEYRDWRRLPNLAAIHPGSRVKKDYGKVGDQVLSIIELQGGRFSACTPATENGLMHSGVFYSWAFSTHYSQVVSDQFQFECEGDRISVGVGAAKREIALKANRGSDSVRLWVHHEATPLEKRVHVTERSGDICMPHWRVFYDALDGKEGFAETPVGVFRFNKHEAVPAIDTPVCPPAIWIEFWNWIMGKD